MTRCSPSRFPRALHRVTRPDRLSVVRQILISILVETEPSENAVRAVAMLAGQNLQHYGHKVKMVTAAHSPVVVDPRRLDGQQMYDALNAACEENNNVAEEVEVTSPTEG